MPRITAFELHAVELPFRSPFRHAAAERRSSESLFLRCSLDDGSVGYGESLPRVYVTGETRDAAFDLLAERVLGRLVGASFHCLEEVEKFLAVCDGRPPVEWVAAEEPSTAAWCAVDLALLDAFARSFHTEVDFGGGPIRVPYSAVVSADVSPRFFWTLIKVRLYGFSAVKLKVDADGGEVAVARARRILPKRCDIRVDANMCWNRQNAPSFMSRLSRYGVRSFEQPLSADDLDGLAELVATTRLGVMADESMADRDSLRALVERRAATAVNVRISKCGGLVASLRRCVEARSAGLDVQIGCQVGESSLLSAAQLVLLAAVDEVVHAEGCFGRHLLRADPVIPLLRFRRRGAAPRRPDGPGLGVRVDERELARWTVRRAVIGAGGREEARTAPRRA